MGKSLVICRLAARDMRRRPAEALLLLLAITAASATLTLGLALHGVTSKPYEQTMAATNGPDVVAQLGSFGAKPHGPGQSNPDSQVLARVRALVGAPGVTGHSGPYLVAGAVLRTRGLAVGVQVQGRGRAPAAVDQPKLTAGEWLRPGGIVLERAFASALGVRVGDRVTLDGRPFSVAGIAVTAASTPYPNLCYTAGCDAGYPANGPALAGIGAGLAWVSQQAAQVLAASDPGPPSYVLNLRLRNPASAPAFASAYDNTHREPGTSDPASWQSLSSWQSIATGDALLVTDEQQVLTPGAFLLGLLAVASVAVLVGGRTASNTRRVGLLKAVGGTPGLVALTLLAENLILALAAAAVGLAAGWLAAPLITSPGAGLVGTPGAPSLTLAIAIEVVVVAIAVALAATLVPAVRAARTSTVSALADAARAPRRRGALIKVSARLPVPLLLGLRLVARRPRRAALGAASIAVTVTGVVAVLAFHALAGQKRFGTAGLGDPVVSRDEQMLLVLTVVLLALAVLNSTITAWATVLDARHSSALVRALGASPRQVRAALAAAQVLPAVPGAIIGIPLGIELFAVANSAGVVAVPPAWWLVAAVLGTLLTVGGLTTIPAGIGARRPAAQILQSETA
jgi:ABC-type lipoprotein release transport system permease subunit